MRLLSLCARTHKINSHLNTHKEQYWNKRNENLIKQTRTHTQTRAFDSENRMGNVTQICLNRLINNNKWNKKKKKINTIWTKERRSTINRTKEVLNLNHVAFVTLHLSIPNCPCDSYIEVTTLHWIDYFYYIGKNEFELQKKRLWRMFVEVFFFTFAGVTLTGIHTQAIRKLSLIGQKQKIVWFWIKQSTKCE